jgi:hypothetical protein
MKRLLCCLLSMLIPWLSISLLAQDLNGIYLSASDYRNYKLSPSIAHVKIHAHHLFHPNRIRVDVNHQTYFYLKDSVFGYRIHMQDFRFFKGEEYEVLETGTIIIYRRYQPAYSPKGYKMESAYFFSESPESALLPLSVINIKRVFPEHFRLHHYLDITFYNKTISTYDDIHHMFCINYLLYAINQTQKINQP